MSAPQTRDVIVGIDAGTSLIKTVAFTREGRQLGSFSLPNVYRTADGDRVEQDMSRTWDDTVAALRGLAASVPDLHARVAAIAVTGQGDGTWLIDDEGRPVAPALLWLDSRAARLVEEIRASPQNAALYRRTGSGLNACQQGPQLAWLQANASECVSRAATAFHCKDWLYFRLTGMRATDPSEVAFSYGNFRTRRYDPETARLIGIADLARLVPCVVDGASVTHPLGAAGASETGLPAGVPVSLGYVDVVATPWERAFTIPPPRSAAPSSARPACTCGSHPPPMP